MLKNVVVPLNKVVFFVVHFYETLVVLVQGRLCRYKVLVVWICDWQYPETSALSISQCCVIFFPLFARPRLSVHTKYFTIARHEHWYQQALGSGNEIEYFGFSWLKPKCEAWTASLTNLNSLCNTIQGPQLWYIGEWSNGSNDLNSCKD